MLPRGNAFLAGCDGSVPGFCLHDELQIVTEAGLSPLQAIQTATINPARLLGREAFARPVAPVGDIILVTARSALRMANVRRVAESGVQHRLLGAAALSRLYCVGARRPWWASRHSCGRLQKSRSASTPGWVGIRAAADRQPAKPARLTENRCPVGFKSPHPRTFQSTPRPWAGAVTELSSRLV
jgi:hypothetical protein